MTKPILMLSLILLKVFIFLIPLIKLLKLFA